MKDDDISLEAALGGETDAIEQAETPQVQEVVDEPAIEAQGEREAEAKALEPEAQPKPETEDEKPWTYHMAMDEKQKRKQLEAELETIRKEQAALKAYRDAAEFEKRRASQKAEVPDVFTDPEGYQQHIQKQAIEPVLPVVRQLQIQLAEVKHGAETVKAANDWHDTLPPAQQQALWAAYGNSADPYAGLVAEYKKTSLLQEVGDDPEAYKQRIIQDYLAQQGQVSQQPTQQQTQFAPSATKMASVSSRGGPKWAGPKSLDDILPE